MDESRGRPAPGLVVAIVSSANPVIDVRLAMLVELGPTIDINSLCRYGRRRGGIETMTTVDLRTRFESEATDVDPGEFSSACSPARTRRSTRRRRRARRGTLGLAPLTLDVDGESLTFTVERRAARRASGADDALVVALDRPAFSDLVQDVASTFGLQMTGRAKVERAASTGSSSGSRCCGASSTAARSTSRARSGSSTAAGAPLDLHRSFRSTTTRRHRALPRRGGLPAPRGRVHRGGDGRGVGRARRRHRRRRARRRCVVVGAHDEGEWYPARILGFNQQVADAARAVAQRPLPMPSASFTDDEFVQRDPDVGDSAEGLLKKIGVVEGISDVSWHKDCSLGGHSRGCCGLTVGISVTGAGRENGELGVVAGSHRANVPVLGVDGLDLPRVPLPTRTGDVTVHCSCTLHMSRPPVSAERRVVYTGFGLAPRPGDHRPELDPAEIRRERAALNDRVRAKQHSSPAGSRTASFDL